MVRTTLTIEREIEDARSTWDAGVGRKREDRPSSSSRKEAKGFGFARVLEPRSFGPGTS